MAIVPGSYQLARWVSTENALVLTGLATFRVVLNTEVIAWAGYALHSAY
jgi:hypothetical protein